MATTQLLGLFHEATPTADTIEQLRGLGVAHEKITVISGMPYRADMLGRPRPRVRLGLAALLGAGLGLLTAVFLTVGIFLLYPLSQGGQPLVPIPPSLIVLFEVTMLGTMWATFFGFVIGNRLPIFKLQLYDPRITEGHVGVLAEVDEGLADQVESVLAANGAHHMHRVEAGPQADAGYRVFWFAALVAVFAVAVVLVLLAYEAIKIPFPSQMVDQYSVAYEQGPRLAAPAEAVPVQGPVLIGDQPASEPVPATDSSLQRGQVLFDIDCALCHGQDGIGNGPLSSYFSPKPADLTGEYAQGLSEAEIFLVITQGRGIMPSLAENLSPAERWDVVNYIRSLKN
jgi:mono/diheme cytochrome c family protein